MNLGLKDLFIGVVHLFVIFLPGATVLLAALYAFPAIGASVKVLGLGAAGEALLFLGGSYFIGHLVSLFSAKLEDRSWERLTGEKKFARLRDEASPAMRLNARLIIEKKIPSDVVAFQSLFRWARTLLRDMGGPLQAEVERKDADRRFFRNIRIVLLLCGLLLSGEGIYSWLTRREFGDVITGLILLVLLYFSHLRYQDQYIKFTRLIFESLIVAYAKELENARSFLTHAGGVVWRKVGTRAEVLLLTSSESTQKKEWLFPKGKIKKNETAEQAAVREVEEEAGVQTEVQTFIDLHRFAYQGKDIWVAYYLMRHLQDSESHENRDKQWLSLAAAEQTLSFADLRRILRQARDMLGLEEVGD